MDNAEKKSIAPPATENATPEALRRSVDGLWRTQSATMALLKHAYALIGASEKRIAEQDRYIRQLEDLAATDPLTGLMNRRGFEKFFEMEQARIRRGHSPGALLILIDLDRFKPINDTYGHLAGDACLKVAAEKLLQGTRMLDGAARFGGDEFAILLTQLEPEKALPHLEKIRQLLEDTPVEWQGKTLHFGASVGAAVLTAKSDFEQAYHGADKNLYVDKKRHHAAADLSASLSKRDSTL